MNKICFREEAKDWNEALPIGNGFLGAMVFGKTGTERLQINEEFCLDRKFYGTCKS